MEQKLTVYSAYYKRFLKMLGSKRLANVAGKKLLSLRLPLTRIGTERKLIAELVKGEIEFIY